jgi:hypothetical protein
MDDMYSDQDMDEEGDEFSVVDEEESEEYSDDPYEEDDEVY